MIKKLRVKFIIIIMALLSLVLAAIFGAINIMMANRETSDSYAMMQRITESGGTLKPKTSPNNGASHMPYDILEFRSYFSVVTDAKGIVETVLYDTPTSFSNSEIASLVSSSLATGKETGKVSGQRFLITEKNGGYLIVFLESRTESKLLSQLLNLSLIVAGAGFVAVFIIALFLSAWAVRPVRDAFDRQRRFIADASHELKTPLTIVSASADVLAAESQTENKWLSYIQSETARMSGLVNNMLYLARQDSDQDVPIFSIFNLSTAVESAALPFESIAYEANKSLVIDIPPGIQMKGDEARIKQLTAILIDNGIKNAFPAGEVRIALKAQGNKRLLIIYNTGEGVLEAEKQKIFERFYRSDASRTRDTGGYGLGLAIAKSVADAPSGKISVASHPGKWAEFTVTLPSGL